MALSEDDGGTIYIGDLILNGMGDGQHKEDIDNEEYIRGRNHSPARWHYMLNASDEQLSSNISNDQQLQERVESSVLTHHYHNRMQ